MKIIPTTLLAFTLLAAISLQGCAHNVVGRPPQIGQNDRDIMLASHVDIADVVGERPHHRD